IGSVFPETRYLKRRLQKTRWPAVQTAARLPAPFLKSVFLELFVERRNGDAERLRGVHFVSFGSRHRLLNGDTLYPFERLPAERQLVNHGRLVGNGRQEPEVARIENIRAIDESRRAGERIFQLAHVAGPSMGAQRLERGLAHLEVTVAE